MGKTLISPRWKDIAFDPQFDEEIKPYTLAIPKIQGVRELTDRFLALCGKILPKVIDITLGLRNSLQSILKRRSYLKIEKDLRGTIRINYP